MSINNVDETIIEALRTIKGHCNQRKHDCKNCELSNYQSECLVYEYPYLWNVEPTTITKFLLD